MNMVASCSGVGDKMPDAFADIIEVHWPTGAPARPHPKAEKKPAADKKKKKAPSKPAGAMNAVSLNVLVDMIKRAKKTVHFTCAEVTSKEVLVCACVTVCLCMCCLFDSCDAGMSVFARRRVSLCRLCSSTSLPLDLAAFDRGYLACAHALCMYTNLWSTVLCA